MFVNAVPSVQENIRLQDVGILLVYICISDYYCFFFFFSSRRRHTRLQGDWSSDVCSSDLDVLISDLNIGEDGDGFLVVSAMRHVQPGCTNFILTGYPAFETALQAIHNQVEIGRASCRERV